MKDLHTQAPIAGKRPAPLHRTTTLWALLLLLIATSCRTGSPERSSINTDGVAGDLQTRHFPELEALGSDQFQTLRSTDGIPNDWLQPPTDFYTLGPGDIIEIELLGDPALFPSTSPLTSVSVGPDGKIYYDLLPGTLVWGLTLAQTKQKLESSLKEFVRGTPQVAVTLTGVASRNVWILGVVRSPGVYTLATSMTLLEAITLAGGSPTAGSQELADLHNSYVMRDGKLLPVNFHKLFRQGDLTQNIYLRPNDLVHLRPAIAGDVYVLGAVAFPSIIPFSDSSSVLSAIASCRGPVEYARVGKVVVIRGSLTDPKIAEVDYAGIVKGKIPDVRLEPGDIVYVPFTPYRRLLQFGEAILNQFVSTIAVNEGRNAVLDDPTPIDVTAP